MCHADPSRMYVWPALGPSPNPNYIACLPNKIYFLAVDLQSARPDSNFKPDRAPEKQHLDGDLLYSKPDRTPEKRHLNSDLPHAKPDRTPERHDLNSNLLRVKVVEWLSACRW
jgi:hypothetical protein